MAIAHEITKATQHFQEHVGDRDALERLEHFDSEMKKSGIIRPTVYGFPLPDMIRREPQPSTPSSFESSLAFGLSNQF